MYQKQLLGKRIKELRKLKGFTQESLSEKAGIDSKHLSRIECGVNFPSLDLLTKISDILGVEPYVLFQNLHAKSKNELISNINQVLAIAKKQDVRMFYKILIKLCKQKYSFGKLQYVCFLYKCIIV